jgi:hypothetical protein
MEREIVRRGYQIAQYLPPIERMEQQHDAWKSTTDAAARMRTLMQRALEQEMGMMQGMREKFQEIRSTGDPACNLTSVDARNLLT